MNVQSRNDAKELKTGESMLMGGARQDDSIRRGAVWGPAFALAIGLLAILTTSCATVQQDIRFENLAIEESALPQIEEELAQLRLSPDPLALGDIRARLLDLSKTNTSDVRFTSRVKALQAEAALQAGETKRAAELAQEALDSYRADEIAQLVNARLAPNPEAMLERLEAAIPVADSTALLRAERGLVLEALGRYREAIAAIDEILPQLDEAQAARLKPARDRALSLKDLDGKPSEKTASALARSPARLIDAIVLARYETSLLDWFMGEDAISDQKLYTRMAEALWFDSPAAKMDQALDRALAARFLWQILCAGDTEKLSRYSTRWATRNKSPLPDVPLEVSWFDAALGCVEADIIPLVDGRSFAPEMSVSGAEIWDWIKRVRP